MSAWVDIEEWQLGPHPWAVIIWRGQARTLWGRFAHQAEAERQAKAARRYLADREKSG